MKVPQPGSPQAAILASARLWATQKRWDRVVELTPSLLAANPENLAAYALATRACINTKNHAQAWELAQMGVQLGAQNADAHYLCAIAALNLEKIRAANQHLRTALELAPHWAELHRLQARLLLRRKAGKEALQSLRQAKQLAPTNAEITGELVELEAAGRASGADLREITLRYEEALALEPENAGLHYKLGLHLLRMEADYPPALQHLRSSLQADPRNRATRQAYLEALRYGDPFFRALYAPRRLARRCVQLLDDRHMGFFRALAMLALAPLLVTLSVLSAVFFLLFCWIPALVYGALTLTDFRAVAAGQPAGAFSRWSWSAQPRGVRVALLALVITSPWLLLAVLYWRSGLWFWLLAGLVVASWIDVGWRLARLVYQAGKSRKGFRRPVIGTLAALLALGGMLRLSYDDHDGLGLIISCSLAVVFLAVRNWQRKILY